MERKKEAGLVNRRGQGGGARPKLSQEQQQTLRQLLGRQDFWTTGQVTALIEEKFCVSYSQRQVRLLLRKLGLHFYKPQPRDYRRAEQAPEQMRQRLEGLCDGMKALGWDPAGVALGFADESCPQANCNKARLWSLHPGLKRKVNTGKLGCHNFGFYALRGESVISPLPSSQAEDFLPLLERIRQANRGYRRIIVIWDNLPAHKMALVEQKARELGIVLVHTPPYSPDLNPIERIWRQVKRKISLKGLIKDKQELQQLIEQTFSQCAQKLSFAASWLENIWQPVLRKCAMTF